MRDSLEIPNECVPLPRTITHQHLIYQIKSKLKLPNLQSSFISRHNILQFIKQIHHENQQIKHALEPPSAQPEVAKIQDNCMEMRRMLNEKEDEQEKLKMSISKLEEDLAFMGEYYNRNVLECENIEKQIQQIIQQKQVSLSHCDSQQISNLMDRFMGYFEEPEGYPGGADGLNKIENSSYMDSLKSMNLKEEPGQEKERGQFGHPKLQIVNYTYTGYEQQQIIKP